MRTFWMCAVSALMLSGALQAKGLASEFQNPPADTRPMVRWWWFGPNLDDKEIVREIRAMKSGGFGGFELQSVYPLVPDGNVPFLSDAHVRAVHLANITAHAEGMRVDVTLGSGWPFGGPHISADKASAGLKFTEYAVPAGATRIDVPARKTGDRILACFVGLDRASASLIECSGAPVTVEPAKTDRTLFVVLQRPTGQQVKRASVGAEGYVMDHMNSAAVQTHLDAVGGRLLQAFSGLPPYAVFSDSLEAFGSDWTGDFLAEFQRRRGYDLKPHLLELQESSPHSSAIRRDWGITLRELVDERYLVPVSTWAHQHGTKFRSQTYGTPPVSLASNRLVDLAEGEGARWRSFTSTRWASSANHIYGNPVTSAESWTWLHSGAFQATPLDVKAEADVLMLEGVNQFIAHGWPYSPPSAGEPGWSLYAAAVFNDHNPWWGVMADVNRYLQRMSYLLRQGTPVSDVAIFLPEDDVLAAMKPGSASINDPMRRFVPDDLAAGILDAGYNFDYIDSQVLAEKALSYKILVLPRVHRIAPQVMERIEAFAKAGGTVIAIDNTPDAGASFLNADVDAEAVRAISRRLFNDVHARVVAVSGIGGALRKIVPPDLTGAPSDVGFVHRRVQDSDIYFVANTSNAPVSANLSFRSQNRLAQWWDARSGAAHPWKDGPVNLAPYESRVFVFGRSASAATAETRRTAPRRRILSEGWSIAFGNEPKNVLASFSSWTAMPGRQFYSGTATYSCRVTLSRADIAAGLTMLDFGPGSAVEPPSGRVEGTRALLGSPLHEAAEVYVNGKRAGAVWSAPFSISLRGLVHPGENRLEIRISNTAINLLAGRPPADYSALTAKYGERFQPQNMDHLRPLPSGLLQAPALTTGQ